jgi:glyoxylase-like metal-dependent hydrolase (beta-lactamase superfamily II)
MRKSIIALAATVVAAQVMVAASAQTTSPEENVFRYKVGDYEVVLLSDGQLDEDTRGILDTPDEVLAPYLSVYGTYPSAINAFAVITPDRTILIDAGGSGLVAENLRVAGIYRVDAIQLTHMHWDHIGGLTNNDDRVFDDSILSLSEIEADYWGAQDGAEKKTLDLYPVQLVEPFALNEIPEGKDGVFPIEAYGHTPGHTMYMVASKGEKLLIWGDIIHAPAIQMPRPEISMRWDVDPDAARVSRAKILEYVVTNNIPVAGAHIAFPSVGTIEKVAEGYKFTPVAE